MKAEVSPSVGGRCSPGLEVGVGGIPQAAGWSEEGPGRPRPNTMPTILKCIYTRFFLKKGYTFYFFKNLKKVKTMNLYFILHGCRIHNSNLAENNILGCIQNKMGNQVTRQLRLCYNQVLLAGGKHTASSPDWATPTGPSL